MLTLNPGAVRLSELERVWRDGESAVLPAQCDTLIAASAQVIADAAKASEPVYGVNTGFGKLASKRIAPKDTQTLQRNLVLSHCAGVGEPLEHNTVRLIMVLKLISLGRGVSGVQIATVRQIEALLAAGVTPMIPAQGSVGASGDLAPLAHMAAVLIGEGRAYYKDELLSGGEALKQAGLSPLTLEAKEGLALLNGTQVSTALALVGLFDAWRAADSALITGALSTDAAMGSSAPFDARIHEVRGHRGQIDAAAALRSLMHGSPIRESHREDDERVQDPYCIRCQPQVMGACIDILRQAANTLRIEANAATDNPLVFADTAAILSGGNFHAEPVAFAADQIALAIAEIGAITQRRVALMVDPALNFGLPPFLSPDPGVNSGFMVAEITSAALMSENKHLASPCSVDSTPTSANQEDHVSMACHAARRLKRMNENLARIIGIELLTAVQSIEFRAPLKTSEALRDVMAFTRKSVPSVVEDRYMADDLALAANLVIDGGLLAHVSNIAMPTIGDS